MKNIKIIKVLFCLALFASPAIANADDVTEQEADVQDTVAAPIDDYVPLLVLGALGLGYVVLSKKKTLQTKG